MVQLVSSPPVQTRRKAAEWQRLVDEWRGSGLSAAQYASRVGVRAQTLTWWRSELSRRGREKTTPASPVVTFLPVTVRRSTAAGGTIDAFARIEVGSFTVQVLPSASVAQVAELCRALASEASC